MALRDELSRSDTRPPHLRLASRPTSSCGTCKYMKIKAIGGRGACRLYNGYPVRANQVCDAYARG